MNRKSRICCVSAFAAFSIGRNRLRSCLWDDQLKMLRRPPKENGGTLLGHGRLDTVGRTRAPGSTGYPRRIAPSQCVSLGVEETRIGDETLFIAGSRRPGIGCLVRTLTDMGRTASQQTRLCSPHTHVG